MKSRAELLFEIEAALSAELEFAKIMQERGESGIAKLAYSAMALVRNAINKAMNETVASDDGDFVKRLAITLRSGQETYEEVWLDDDGIGSSTFGRVLSLVERAANDGPIALRPDGQVERRRT